MKKNMLTKSLMSALLLTSSLAIAQSDYPAADYQPKVLYTNPDYKESAAPTAQSAAAKPAPVEVEADPNFPATNFQPKVVYSDPNYKHSSAAPSTGSSSSKASSSASSAEVSLSVESAPASEVGSSNTSLIGLIALAAVGFFVYSKNSGSKGVESGASEPVYVDSNEATGVEKYLDRAGINKTGVAKYLEKQGSTSTTGVARYMAKQVIKDREAAAAKATGVEKYLRDKV